MLFGDEIEAALPRAALATTTPWSYPPGTDVGALIERWLPTFLHGSAALRPTHRLAVPWGSGVNVACEWMRLSSTATCHMASMTSTSGQCSKRGAALQS